MREIVLPPNESPKKVETFLKKEFPTGYVRKLFRKHGVRINGRRAKEDDLIRAGDRIQLYIPFEATGKTPASSARGPRIETIFEDESLLVINKPAGLVCHPTKGDEYSSLISRIRLYLGAGSSPHLINRLDRETSGLVLVARHAEAAAHLRKLWETRQVAKEYLAIVHGRVPFGKTIVNAPIGPDIDSAVAIKDAGVETGAPAETHVFPLRHLRYENQELSLLRVMILTGRKHQIRIHLAHLGHPVIGDKLYGGDENIYLRFALGTITEEDWRGLITRNQALHAFRLTIPWFGTQRTFTCAAESWFQKIAAYK